MHYVTLDSQASVEGSHRTFAILETAVSLRLVGESSERRDQYFLNIVSGGASLLVWARVKGLGILVNVRYQ
jgi:hypothetical protein